MTETYAGRAIRTPYIDGRGVITVVHHDIPTSIDRVWCIVGWPLDVFSSPSWRADLPYTVHVQ